MLESGPSSLGAGRTILRQAGTLRGTEARLGTDDGHICMLRFRAELVTKCLQRRSRKGGCHRPFDFLKVLKKHRFRVLF